MRPEVIAVTEQNVLGANNTVQKALVVKYRVGMHGPFTLVTSQADLNSGAALAQMQEFATTLAGLPVAQMST